MKTSTVTKKPSRKKPRVVRKVARPIKPKKKERKKMSETQTAATLPHIVINGQRSTLNEGRQRGVGQSFATRKDNAYTTVFHPSTCKDYMSDIVWAERTGKSGSWYGLSAKPTGAFADDNGYVVATVLKQRGYSGEYTEYDGYAQDVAALKNGRADILACFHELEEALKLPARTTMQDTDLPDMFLLTLPKWWTEATARISLYTLLLRTAMRGFDPKNEKRWEDMAKRTEYCDSYYNSHVLPKLKKILAGTHTLIDDTATTTNPHQHGIYYVDVEPITKTT